MDAVTKRIVRKSAFLFLMLTVSVAGIRRVMMWIEELPAARKTAAERTPVIVLDTGHGEATETESQKMRIAPCGAIQDVFLCHRFI